MKDTHRILIAEDERISLLQLQRFLSKELNVETIVARDGEEAWELYNSHDIQFVISDWEMPRCDGPELCRRIREHQQRYTYFIMLTARERGEDLLAGMASGADDYVRKPPDFAELKSRIKAGFRVLDLERRLEAQNAQLETALSDLRDAVTVAGQVQRRMLPDEMQIDLLWRHTGLKLAYAYQSCESLGGDVLNVDELEDGKLALFLGDVSGHGIAASLAAVSLSACVRTNLRNALDQLSLTAQVNKFCCSEFPEEVYASMVYLQVDAWSQKVSCLVAGHPPLLRIGNDGVITEYNATIPPLGMFADSPTLPDLVEVELQPKERLVAYTDGIIEARNPAGEMFSQEHLALSLLKARELPLKQVPARVLQDVSAWRGPGVAADDDITVVVLSFEHD